MEGLQAQAHKCALGIADQNATSEMAIETPGPLRGPRNAEHHAVQMDASDHRALGSAHFELLCDGVGAERIIMRSVARLAAGVVECQRSAYSHGAG
jgi:hypothetical protein